MITAHPGRSIITIEFNGETQTYVFDVANKPIEDPETGDETPEVLSLSRITVMKPMILVSQRQTLVPQYCRL